MICPSCGGDFANWARRCPYCDSVNEKADERIYMEHMEALRQRLDSVDEEAEAEYREDISRTVRKTGKLIVAAVAAAIFVSAGIVIMRFVETTKQENYASAQYEWEKQEYPKLDALYDAGKYDEILNEDTSEFGIYSWAHYYFVEEFYQGYKYCVELTELLNAGEIPDSFILGEGIYHSLYLLYEADDAYLSQLRNSYDQNGRYGITEEEREMIVEYRSTAHKLLYEDMNLSEDEVNSLYESTAEAGYIRIGECFDKADEMLKNWTVEGNEK